MARLDGTTRTVQVAAGYSITAPGITGDATAYSGVPGGTRAPGVEDATDAVAVALTRVEQRRSPLAGLLADAAREAR